MTTMLPSLYWIALFLFTTGALAFALLAWVNKAIWVIAAAGTALAVSLMIASFPAPESGPIIATLLSIAGIALAVIGGGPATTAILKLATRDSVPNGEHGGILIESETREVLRGGLTIGILERLAVTGSIIAGFFGAIAVIIAVKGVGRFSELEAAESRERFIIGTFVSLIWACACGAIVVFALN